MKVRLPLMVLDQFEAVQSGDEAVERYMWDSTNGYGDDIFLDGPVTSRVAILDFDEKTGQLHAPVKLGGTDKVARYEVPDGAPGAPQADTDDRSFQSVSVLAGVLHALHLFEAKDVLGRRIEWAFDGNQLLVIPRAGNWRNAYYERATSSLQFFSFAGDEKVPMVHTSLSLDIVSHEAGHAILDAVAPYLYDCVTPQSLGLHEAVGDLTALFASLAQSKLRERLLNAGDGDISGSNSYTRVATAFGFYGTGNESLRMLWNDKTIDDIADPTDAHGLSEVLTGTVYQMLVAIFDRRWDELSASEARDPAKRNLALDLAGKLTRRLVLRGLDYLPPGEVSFADYIRAIVAADTVSNPYDFDYRDTFIDLCVQRNIAMAHELTYTHPLGLDALLLDTVDIDELVSSDWHAYQFVERHRNEFHVPLDAGFLIEPRLVVTKQSFRTGEEEVDYHEMILKISWEELEEVGRRRLWVRFGTTVAFDAETGAITAVVTTNPMATDNFQQAEHRAAMVTGLDDVGFFDDDETALDHESGLRVRGTGRTLHAARHGHGPALDVEAELGAMNDIVDGMQS